MRKVREKKKIVCGDSRGEKEREKMRLYREMRSYQRGVG